MMTYGFGSGVFVAREEVRVESNGIKKSKALAVEVDLENALQIGYTSSGNEVKYIRLRAFCKSPLTVHEALCTRLSGFTISWQGEYPAATSFCGKDFAAYADPLFPFASGITWSPVNLHICHLYLEVVAPLATENCPS